MAEEAVSPTINDLSYLTSKDLLGLKRQVLKYSIYYLDRPTTEKSRSKSRKSRLQTQRERTALCLRAGSIPAAQFIFCLLIHQRIEKLKSKF